MIVIEFTSRQKYIIELVKKHQPITSEQLAEKLNMTRAALRPDLTVLTMSDILEARPKVGYFYSGKPINNIASDFIRSIKVGDIKSAPIVVSEDTTVYDAIVTLFLRNVGTVYVQKNSALTGLVSRKDFIKVAIGGADMQKMPIGMIMTRMPNIIHTTDDESAFEVAGKIILHEVDSIPVVESFTDTEGTNLYRITGKVSKTNITKLLYDLCKE